MGNFRGWELILVLLLALLLFGGFKKLPDAARGVGRSLRIFKAETKGLVDDDDAETTPAAKPVEAASATPEVAAAAPATVDATDTSDAKKPTTA